MPICVGSTDIAKISTPFRPGYSPTPQDTTSPKRRTFIVPMFPVGGSRSGRQIVDRSQSSE